MKGYTALIVLFSHFGQKKFMVLLFPGHVIAHYEEKPIYSQFQDGIAALRSAVQGEGVWCPGGLESVSREGWVAGI